MFESEACVKLRRYKCWRVRRTERRKTVRHLCIFLAAGGIHKKGKDPRPTFGVPGRVTQTDEVAEKLINPAREKHGCSDAKKNRTRVWVSIEGETRQDAATEA